MCIRYYNNLNNMSKSCEKKMSRHKRRCQVLVLKHAVKFDFRNGQIASMLLNRPKKLRYSREKCTISSSS